MLIGCPNPNCRKKFAYRTRAVTFSVTAEIKLISCPYCGEIFIKTFVEKHASSRKKKT
jgi:aspartate carbamoyltransferase regulatory subunit